MDTVVRPPDSISPSIATARRRRWPRIVLSVLVFLGVGLLVGSIWVANYDPFVRGFIGYGPHDGRIRVVEVDAFGVSGRVFELPVSGPARFRYRLSIHNDGPIAVRIDHVGSPRSEQVALRIVPVEVIPDLTANDDYYSFEPWHPFVLKPGHDAAIEMLLTYDNDICFPVGDSERMWPLPVNYRVFGVPRQTQFEVDPDVHVVGTEDC